MPYTGVETDARKARANLAEVTRDPDAKLTITDLVKSYGSQLDPAVDRLNMSISAGEFVSLLGPSGCGKTTTLRMVAGLLDPTSGSIVVDGREMTKLPVHKRGMGMVFQSYALFPHMNVIDNVAFGLQMRKVGRKEQQKRAMETLEMVKLDHLAKRRPRELSGGQQQRVALARALVVEPTMLLLDEPLSNLDAALRESMRTEIRRIQRRTGATTLFVTHDQDEALEMSDKIALMNGGIIEQFGTPEEIYTRPQTRFAADFIGHAQLIDVEVQGVVGEGKNGEHLYGVTAPGFEALGGAGNPGLSGSRTLLVRPHQVNIRSISDGQEPHSGNVVVQHGHVKAISYTGNVVGHEVALKNGGTFRVESIPRQGTVAGEGDLVELTWSPEDAYILPESREKAPK